MRRPLYSLVALCLLVSATFADGGFGVGNGLTGFWQNKTAAAGGGPATITFLQCANSTTDLTTYTFAAQNVGTATADRHTIVTIHMEDGASAFSVSTVTVGGDSATKAADDNDFSTTQNVDDAIYILANPTGTSEDVVVTASEAVQTMAVCLYQVNNLVSMTPFATNGDSSTTGGAAIDVNTQAGGIVVGAGSTINVTTDTWTGLTEQADTSNAEFTFSTASAQTPTASTPLAILSNFAAGGAEKAIAASFR